MNCVHLLQDHGEVTAADDEFEIYRKRMMLGYKHRPNPLGNPRCASRSPALADEVDVGNQQAMHCAHRKNYY